MFLIYLGCVYDFTLDSYFASLKNTAKLTFSVLTVITGTGHHSLGSSNYKSRILPAIETLVRDELGLEYQLVMDANGYIGSIRVTIKK